MHAAASAALRNLACGAEGRQRIGELGGVETLVLLCTESKSDAVHENAAAALANLADDEANRCSFF